MLFFRHHEKLGGLTGFVGFASRSSLRDRPYQSLPPSASAPALRLAYKAVVSIDTLWWPVKSLAVYGFVLAVKLELSLSLLGHTLSPLYFRDSCSRFPGIP